jgi:hypothetical protein
LPSSAGLGAFELHGFFRGVHCGEEFGAHALWN